ncbi:hypothetical protein MMC08_007007 [Hypocenomyce scalaris]|nr:hypothetical protein [Hypocenomyce scalaris]
MSTRKSRAPSGSENGNSSAASLPPVPRRERGRHGEDQYVSPKKQRRRSRYASGRGYDMPREKPPSKVDLLLCVSEGAPSHSWRTAPLTFDRKRADDRELWEDIQRIYRDELQGPWRRIFGFKKLKHILPVEYTPNGVPISKDSKDIPESQAFMHAVHHPERIRPEREWIDWFTEFKAEGHGKSVGLEFQEGLWADKLAIIAILITVAIVVVSVIWAVRGGQLQTVFTVMSFVLTAAAAEIALVALYYQVTLSS